jgi:hypothetical protein
MSTAHGSIEQLNNQNARTSKLSVTQQTGPDIYKAVAVGNAKGIERRAMP